MTRTLADLLPPGPRPRPGILHLGPGAFFRAHLAVYTAGALAATGGDWGILAAGLRDPGPARLFSASDGLFTLLIRDGAETRVQVPGPVLGGLEPAAILSRMTAPDIRIVTLTLTEKAYGLDPATGGLDRTHPAIADDLSRPGQPRSAVGLVTAALAARRAAGIAPFTPLSCDNLPGNGHVLRRLVLDFAALRDPALAEWIAAQVPFPCTMVDRITPASTPQTLAEAEALTGIPDPLAVETEPFLQWVIEDRFACGRPDWDRAGALFVTDVAPFEAMKLRMLNGTHSLLAWIGLAAGHEHVRDAVADPAIARLAEAHLAAAARTLAPVPGIDTADYARALLERFGNRAIAHRLAQIAMDGTQKLPPRILAPAAEVLARGGDADSFARVTAAWMAHAARFRPLQDPRADEIAAALAGVEPQAGPVAAALMALPGLMPRVLRGHPGWRDSVTRHLEPLLGPAR